MVSRVLSGTHGNIASAVAGFGGLFGDAFLGKYGFISAFIIALIILLLGFIKEWKMNRLYMNETIPIPVVISVDDNTPVDLLFNGLVKSIENRDGRFSKLDKKLEYYFHISSRMLTFKYNGDLYDNERLVSFLQIVRYVLNDVQSRLEYKGEFHLLYLRRPAVAVALGGMFRTDDIVIYQNNDYANTFDCVADIRSRKYKEHMYKFKHFIVDISLNRKGDPNLLIAVQISSHKVSTNDPAFNEYENVITLLSKRNGTLPTDEQSIQSDLWVEYVQEIYNVINTYKGEYTHIVLIHSMPEAIGVMLGMALENYWDIDIYQYDKGNYRAVINLRNIKYYF